MMSFERKKESNSYNRQSAKQNNSSLGRVIGNQSLLSNYGAEYNKPIQREVIIESNVNQAYVDNQEPKLSFGETDTSNLSLTYSLDLGNGVRRDFIDPLERRIINRIHNTPNKIVFPNKASFIQFIEYGVLYVRTNQVTVVDLLEYIDELINRKGEILLGEMLLEEMREIINDPKVRYGNIIPTNASSLKYKSEDVEAHFKYIFEDTKKGAISISSFIDPKTRKKSNKIAKQKYTKYNCWSSIVKAAYNSGLYDKAKAVWACMKGGSGEKGVIAPLNLMANAKRIPNGNAATFIRTLPIGTILSINKAAVKTRDDHVFLYAGTDAGKNKFYEVDSEKIGQSTLQEINERYGNAIHDIWYTQIDDIPVPGDSETMKNDVSGGILG